MACNLPLISVIIPVYNVERFVRACLEAIVHQTYSNLEIIIVNDGSTDNSLEICKEFDDKRIQIISKENGGLSSARNRGLDIAHGEYIFLLDSDDVIHVDAIYELYRNIESTKSDVAVMSHSSIEENESPDIYALKEKTEPILVSGKECNLAFFSSRVDSIDMTVAWGKLYKAELFSGIRYPEGRLHEDEFVTYKIMDRSKKCVYLKNGLYFYRMRNHSIMSQKGKRNYVDAIEAFIQREKYFEDANKIQEQGLAQYRILMEIILFYEYIVDDSKEEELRIELRQCFRKYYRKQLWRKRMDKRTKQKFLVFYCSPLIHHFLTKG